MEENKEAPFNFAIATLMRLDEILKKIVWGSLDKSGVSQEQKYQLVRQYLVNACVLIKDKTSEAKLKTKLEGVRINYKSQQNIAGEVTSIKPSYSDDINISLDNLLIEINNVLQEEGNYFMPKPRVSARY